MIMVRRIGALLLAIAAVVVYIVLRPPTVRITAPSSLTGELVSIGDDFTSNNGQAQYIYQQIYATGVATKDTLALLVKQTDQQAAAAAAAAQSEANNHGDRRVPAELLILVLAVGLFLLTVERHSPPPAPEMSSGAASNWPPPTE